MWFGPLERRKPPIDIISPVEAPPSAAAAEPSVRRLRNVGVAAALSNVSSQISRFNPIGKLMRPPPPTQQTAAAADEIRFTDLQSAACGGGGGGLDDDDTRFDTCDDDAGGGLHIQNIDRMSALYSPSSSNCAATMPSIHVTSSIGGAASRSPTTSDVRRRHRKISRSSENLTTTDDDDLHRHPMENVLVPFAMLSQGLQSLGSNLVDSNKLLSRSCEQFIGLGELASGAGPGT
jgi:hypothetical protein